jgi:hypothetical protein
MQLAAAIAAEKLDEFGDPILSSQCLTQPLTLRIPGKRKRAAMVDGETDADDDNFAGSFTTEDGSDDNSDVMEISNEEVRNALT